MYNNSFDDIFKDKLSDHSSSVKPSLWAGVEQGLNATTTVATSTATSLIGKVLGALVSVSVLTGVGYMASQLDEPSNKEPNFKVISSVNLTPVKEEKVVIDTQKVEELAIAENNSQMEVQKATEKVVVKKHLQKNLKPSTVLTQDENEVATQNINNVTENQQSSQVEDKKDKGKKSKRDGIHMAGEKIVKSFEVQNIAGHDVKKLETWIEFDADWVDITSVQTISHTEGVEFKEIKNEKFNWIIWEAHGVIPANMKLYIEYSFILKEPKTDQDLDKIMPQVK
jgi:hypothetical protein